MIEFFKHAFVWFVTPAIVGGIASYGLVRRELLLGALASLGAVLVCALIAMKMFDGHLLAYNWLYGFLLVVPALLGVVALGSGARQLFNMSAQRFRKDLGSNDVQ